MNSRFTPEDLPTGRVHMGPIKMADDYEIADTVRLAVDVTEFNEIVEGKFSPEQLTMVISPHGELINEDGKVGFRGDLDESIKLAKKAGPEVAAAVFRFFMILDQIEHKGEKATYTNK